jgi:hypothetical protein
MRSGDVFPIDHGPVSRTEIADLPATRLVGYFRMSTADTVVADDDLVIGTTSDDYGLANGQLQDVGPAVAVPDDEIGLLQRSWLH